MKMGYSSRNQIATFRKFALLIDNHYLLVSETHDLYVSVNISLNFRKLKLIPILGFYSAYLTLFSNEISVNRQ